MAFVKARTRDGAEVEVELPENYGELTALAAQLERARAAIAAIRERSLAAQILAAAARARVQPILFERAGDGEPPIVAMFRKQFGLDEENDVWAVRKGDHFVLSAKADGAGQYMGPDEFFENLRKKPEHADLFVDERRGGSGFQDAGVGGSRREELMKLPPEERMTKAREWGIE